MKTRITPAELRDTYKLPESQDELQDECNISVFKSSGPGGQHKNTTMSSVRLYHRPSGLVVIGRRERSQHRNLKDALARLRGKLETLLTPPKKRKRTKPSKAAKEKRLADKRRRSKTKSDRRRIED
ncbi:MAG: peptide chain release factor-like protein [Candidatus Eisenbacteria bacterium]|uniref:Peptide chain release factor-like protein n=1 Tax=Eiseniibacteriota bacterium TaxID=2212470 RepID=A0A7Y2H1E7_UNCEI|nr:peptide chain release factor-like protein [Candidatus Eisenbacteria bacterium]